MAVKAKSVGVTCSAPAALVGSEPARQDRRHLEQDPDRRDARIDPRGDLIDPRGHAHSGAKPIFKRGGYSRLMGADEAGKVTKPCEQRDAIAAAFGRHVR
jgi:hypothetical protein